MILLLHPKTLEVSANGETRALLELGNCGTTTKTIRHLGLGHFRSENWMFRSKLFHFGQKFENMMYGLKLPHLGRKIKKWDV